MRGALRAPRAAHDKTLSLWGTSYGFTRIAEAPTGLRGFMRSLPRGWVSAVRGQLNDSTVVSWPSREALASAIFEHIESFYDRKRRHSTLAYLSPWSTKGDGPSQREITTKLNSPPRSRGVSTKPDHLQFYNTTWMHSSLKFMTPEECYRATQCGNMKLPSARA